MTTAPVPAVPRWISDPPASPRRTRAHPWLGAVVRALSLARDRLPAGVARRAAGARADGAAGDLPPSAAFDEFRIDQLYHHRRLSLVRLALLLVDDLPTAEDVVQDAFIALFRRHGRRLAAVDDPEAYLRTSVVNGARSVLRRRRTVRAHVPEREQHAPPPEDHVLLREDHREVLAALGHLTARQREVLVLRYWSHLTEAQIAETLGLSRGTVKSTASRALVALGKRLEGSR
ncbi:sigma-70 family RNA polymerase sigma factor [Streptomyces sp. NPDC050997]|uniref:RNA polymerase sigma factor n=1 Tax=Streptomyces sp. NPDC050997 TaxID=3155519 RepID=UPI0034295AAD